MTHFSCGRELLKERCGGNKFKLKDMMEVLRDKKSGINRPRNTIFLTIHPSIHHSIFIDLQNSFSIKKVFVQHYNTHLIYS